MELSTSTNILYERTDGSCIPVKESIRLCAQAGYREMDFCFVDQVSSRTDFVRENWRDYLLELKDFSASLGVTFTQSHCALYDFCRQDDPFAQEMVRRSLVGSRLLGIPWMVTHPSTKATSGKTTTETRLENIAYFRKLSDEAEKQGVGIAIENMWGRTPEGRRKYAAAPEEFFDLLDALDSKNVGACWDAEHASIEGLDQPSALKHLGSRLKALHISDQTSANNIHILPYMGVTEWTPILRSLAEIGYNGPFNFEIQHYLLTLPPELFPAALRLSYEIGTYMVEQIRSLSPN